MAQRCLKPETGVSIPSSYTSYLAPMISSKLWNSARNMEIGMPSSPMAAGINRGLETPFVVHFHNAHVIAAAQPLFSVSTPQRIHTHTHTHTRTHTQSIYKSAPNHPSIAALFPRINFTAIFAILFVKILDIRY